jgi:polysaccharide deacetylase family protein (PEP-CTERM system associated)
MGAISQMTDPAVRNAMTVDVEDYFHVSAFSAAISRRQWESLEYRAEKNTEKLLALFAESGIHATFFVLGWVAEKSPLLIRRIHSAGHEVACHGMEHELVYRQTPEVFRSETRKSKAVIEDIVGDRILGYRAASYSITNQSLWALDILSEEGFLYDSSIFPVRHDRYGIPDASVAPGVVEGPKGSRLVEFPLATARIAGMRIPVAGGGYFRLLPYWLTRRGLRSINEDEGRPFIFYLHPWEIDPDQPRIRAGRLSRFRHYTNLSACESRLRKLVSQFRFGTAADTLRYLALLPPAGKFSRSMGR